MKKDIRIAAVAFVLLILMIVAGILIPINMSKGQYDDLKRENKGIKNELHDLEVEVQIIYKELIKEKKIGNANKLMEASEGVQSKISELEELAVIRNAEEEALRLAEEAAVQQTQTQAVAYYTTGLSEEEAREFIRQHESGGDYNALSSTGKYYGAWQLNTHNPYFAEQLAIDSSPEAQDRLAEEYVMNTYGSWSAAQAAWVAHQQTYGWGAY